MREFESQTEGTLRTRQHIGAKRARRSLVESALIFAVLLYAALLLGGPIAAIAWGALRAGPATLWLQLTSPDALSALKLTLSLCASATLINTVFGVCIALVLARDDLKGRWFLNGLVDLP